MNLKEAQAYSKIISYKLRRVCKLFPVDAEDLQQQSLLGWWQNKNRENVKSCMFWSVFTFLRQLKPRPYRRDSKAIVPFCGELDWSIKAPDQQIEKKSLISVAISKTKRPEIVYAVLSGEEYAEIGARYGLSAQRVGQIWQEAKAAFLK